MSETETLLADATYDGWPLRIFAVEEILKQEGPVQYVWPDEGHFVNGKWRFHTGKRPDKDDIEYPTMPLLIDQASAQTFKVCYDALNDVNKDRCRDKCESARWWTAYIISEVFWPRVSFG